MTGMPELRAWLDERRAEIEHDHQDSWTGRPDQCYCDLTKPCPDRARELAAVDGLVAVVDENRILRQQRAIFRDRLANAVVAASVESETTDGFISWYLMPTGPIHKGIHELQEYAHITVRPGFDGRKDSRHPLDPFGLEPFVDRNIVIEAGSPEASDQPSSPNGA